MGIWESALILLGIGIVSERFGAGVGLGELGTGIRTLAAAPLGGIGTGMGEFGTGLRTFAEALGDIGRGFGELFANIPGFGGGEGFGGGGGGARNGNGVASGNGGLVPDSGNYSTYQVGGGGNVPNGPVLTLESAFGKVTGTYTQHLQFYTGAGFTETQAHSLIDPHFVKAGYLV